MIKTHDIITPFIISILKKYKPGKLFDYGCGDGAIARTIRKLGYEIVAYDIDEPLIKKLQTKSIHIEYLTESEFRMRFTDLYKFFDYFLCSLVVCTIEEDEILLKILEDCSKLLKPEGLFILLFCNPLYTWVKNTELQIKFLPNNFEYSKKFKIKKKMKHSGNIREDIHRPLSFYENKLNEKGFTIKEIYQTTTKDLSSGLDVSDFILLLCKKN